MLSNIIKLIELSMIILLAAYLNAYAGDFDDGIKIDEKIEKYDFKSNSNC